MAITIHAYNHTTLLLLGGGTSIDFDALKIVLLDNTASFVATDTTINTVTNTGSKEVSGNGWSAGGVLITNTTLSTVATSVACLDADDVSVLATGGDIGPAYAAVIYDSTVANGPVLFYIDFDGPKSEADGNSFIIRWSANGIFRLSSAP